MFRFAPVAALIVAGISLTAAQRPADDNAFPRTKANGRATVEYKDEKVQAVGHGRARRWMTPPVPGFPTTMLLPAALPGG